MRGLLECARWELLWQWRQMRSQWRWALTESIVLPLYSLFMAGSSNHWILILLWSGLVPLCAIVLLAVRPFQWLFGGTLALERTSGRAGWQSVLGRCLVWLPELCGAELLRQFVVWASIKRDLATISFFQRAGIDVFDAAEAEKLMGPRPFLCALCITFGFCAMALAVAMLSKSGKRRHKTSMVTGYVNLLAVGMLVWMLWRITRIPPAILGGVSIAVGLPLSCYLLEYKVE